MGKILFVGIDYDSCYDSGLLDYIADLLKGSQVVYDKVVIMPMSNRQSLSVDIMNAKRKKNGSYFLVLETLPSLLSEKLGIPVELDTALLADVVGGFGWGYSLDKALSALRNTAIEDLNHEDPSIILEHASSPEDAYKIRLIGFHIQKLAAAFQGTDTEIDYWGFDDNSDILNRLCNFYSDNRNMCPANVSLSFFSYAASNYTPEAGKSLSVHQEIYGPSIRGTGAPAQQVDEFIRCMIQLNDFELNLEKIKSLIEERSAARNDIYKLFCEYETVEGSVLQNIERVIQSLAVLTIRGGSGVFIDCPEVSMFLNVSIHLANNIKLYSENCRMQNLYKEITKWLTDSNQKEFWLPLMWHFQTLLDLPTTRMLDVLTAIPKMVKVDPDLGNQAINMVKMVLKRSSLNCDVSVLEAFDKVRQELITQKDSNEQVNSETVNAEERKHFRENLEYLSRFYSCGTELTPEAIRSRDAEIESISQERSSGTKQWRFYALSNKVHMDRYKGVFSDGKMELLFGSIISPSLLNPNSRIPIGDMVRPFSEGQVWPNLEKTFDYLAPGLKEIFSRNSTSLTNTVRFMGILLLDPKKVVSAFADNVLKTLLTGYNTLEKSKPEFFRGKDKLVEIEAVCNRNMRFFPDICDSDEKLIEVDQIVRIWGVDAAKQLHPEKINRMSFNDLLNVILIYTALDMAAQKSLANYQPWVGSGVYNEAIGKLKEKAENDTERSACELITNPLSYIETTNDVSKGRFFSQEQRGGSSAAEGFSYAPS